jgi:hypothetical protein
MATVTVRNGVDVQTLLDMIDAIATKPELARFTWSVRDVLASPVPVKTTLEVIGR